MIPWRNRLEVRILALSVILPLAGVMAISVGVLFFLESGIVDMVRIHSEASPEIASKSIENLMMNGRPEIVKPFIDSLQNLEGIDEIRLVSFLDNAQSQGSSLSGEQEAVEDLIKTGEPSVIQTGGKLVFLRPLANGPECRECHAEDPNILGATRISIPLGLSLGRARTLIWTVFFWAAAGIVSLGYLFWYVTRKLIVRPVIQLHAAAESLTGGDLTVDVPRSSQDEIGMLGRAFRESQGTLSTVIARINGVAARIADVSSAVAKESAEVVEGTGVEADAFEHIAASMQELNASIRTIAANIEGLKKSVGEAHQGSEEITAVHKEIFGNIDQLETAMTDSSSATGEMSHTIRELSYGAGQLSTVSKDTFKALRTLESYLEAVRENARQSANHSEKVTKAAEEIGVTSVKNTIDGMDKIRKAVSETSTYVSSLGSMSKQIGEVVDVIDEVTDQTALLALNAAILAAQAGEDGLGFKVVAAEIRKLAVRSAGSTVEISKLISSVQENVAGAVQSMKEGLESIESGVGYAREAGKSIATIVAGAEESREMTASIRRETEDQTETLGAVKEAMEKLDSMAKFLARGTEEQQREANSIFEAAESVKLFVSQLKQAAEFQLESSRNISIAMERAAEGAHQMANALEEEEAGSTQIMRSLAEVVELPGRTRKKAASINHNLRSMLKDMELLQAEVKPFKVLEEADGETLVLGVVPLETPAQMHKRFTPLVRHLSRKLGVKVVLKVALDFAGAVSDLGEGRTQLGYLSPSTYVEAREKYGVVLLAKALREGKPFHHSIIVTTAGTGITSLEDLEERSFAFGDPHSTSSHIVPKAMLEQGGITLGSSSFLGHHDDVAKAILREEYDAGAVMESVAHRYAGEGLVFVATSPPVPEFNFSAAATLPLRVRSNAAEALLELSLDSEETREVLESLGGGQTGFVAAENADYQCIAEMMRRNEPVTGTGVDARPAPRP